MFANLLLLASRLTLPIITLIIIQLKRNKDQLEKGIRNLILVILITKTTSNLILVYIMSNSTRVSDITTFVQGIVVLQWFMMIIEVGVLVLTLIRLRGVIDHELY
jgi:hypothetical protein